MKNFFDLRIFFDHNFSMKLRLSIVSNQIFYFSIIGISLYKFHKRYILLNPFYRFLYFCFFIKFIILIYIFHSHPTSWTMFVVTWHVYFIGYFKSTDRANIFTTLILIFYNILSFKHLFHFPIFTTSSMIEYRIFFIRKLY